MTRCREGLSTERGARERLANLVNAMSRDVTRPRRAGATVGAEPAGEAPRIEERLGERDSPSLACATRLQCGKRERPQQPLFDRCNGCCGAFVQSALSGGASVAGTETDTPSRLLAAPSRRERRRRRARGGRAARPRRPTLRPRSRAASGAPRERDEGRRRGGRMATGQDAFGYDRGAERGERTGSRHPVPDAPPPRQGVGARGRIACPFGRLLVKCRTANWSLSRF